MGLTRLLIAVPTTEIVVPLLWLAARWRAWPRVCIALLFIFSLAFGVHVMFAKIPQCGCMGRLIVVQNSLHEARIVLARNGILIMLLVIGALLLRARDRVERKSRMRGRGSVAASGFTLIETILVIALIVGERCVNRTLTPAAGCRGASIRPAATAPAGSAAWPGG